MVSAMLGSGERGGCSTDGPDAAAPVKRNAVGAATVENSSLGGRDFATHERASFTIEKCVDAMSTSRIVALTKFTVVCVCFLIYFSCTGFVSSVRLLRVKRAEVLMVVPLNVIVMNIRVLCVKIERLLKRH